MSIKKKFATAVATASLLAGLFGSAFVPSALAAREVPLDTPSVAKTETWTADDDYIMPTLGANDDVTGADRVFWATTVDDLYYSNNYDTDYVYIMPEEATDGVAIDYYLFQKTSTSPTTGEVTTADLKATSSSSVIKVKWAYLDGGASAACDDVDSDDVFTTSDTVTDVDGEDDGYGDFNRYSLCIHGNGKPGTATISVVANGVTLAPVTVTVVGDISSITIAPSGSYVSEDNLSVDDFFTVTAKDSAGTVINGPQTGVAGGVYLDNPTFGDILPSEENEVNAQGDEIDFISTSSESNDAVNAAGEDNYAYTKYDLNADVCLSETATGEGDGDAGEAYSLAVGIENDDNDVITSNSITITCTGPGSDAKLSKFEVEETSGALDYADDNDDVLSIYAYFVDQSGRPLGAGADLDMDDDFIVDFAGDSNLNEVLYDLVSTDGTNKVEIGYLSPDMSQAAIYPYTISVENSDLQSATEVAKSLATSYTAQAVSGVTYNITVQKPSANTRKMSVNFGAFCSNRLVTFEVEFANLDTKEVNRRANVNGVASLTLVRNNTKIFVTAYCAYSGQVSELRGVRFR